MPPADPLKDLLELVRTAARDGVVQALQTRATAGPNPIAPLLDKRSLAHALGVSTATVDRLCRQQRIPFVPVGEVRRFDLDAVRAVLQAHAPGPVKAESPAQRPASDEAPIPDVRLLSRSGGR